jgi:hypothetical protein
MAFGRPESMWRAAFFAAGALIWLEGAALAEDAPKNVRPRATVEVLDSTAQVDDVISQLRDKKANAAKDEKKGAPAATEKGLKVERPKLAPDGGKAPGAAKGADAKAQTGRAPRTDRTDANDRERPRRRR